MSDLLALVVAVALLAANAFFVGAEFSLVAARRTQIEPQAESSRRARATLDAMRNVSLMMAGAQLGITLCSLGLGAVAEPAVAHRIEPLLNAAGLPDSWLHPAAFAVALLVVVAAHVVIGEMVPKNLALAGPDRAALILGPPLAAYVRATRPLIVSLNAMANATLRLVGVQPTEEVSSAATGEQLADLVEESRREGLMDSEEHSRVTQTLTFTTRTSLDAMIAQRDVQALESTATLGEVEALAGKTGHSRFPVGADWAHYVHLKDVIAARHDGDDAISSAVLRPLGSVAADAPLLDVLAAMRDGSTHVLRVEQGGGVAGIVTLDDVLITLFPPRPAGPK